MTFVREIRFLLQDKTENGTTGQYCVRLDQRKLVTPAGNPLVIPQSRFPLAILVAREWSEQRKILKQHSLPLVCFVAHLV